MAVVRERSEFEQVGSGPLTSTRLGRDFGAPTHGAGGRLPDQPRVDRQHLLHFAVELHVQDVGLDRDHLDPLGHEDVLGRKVDLARCRVHCA